MNKKKVTMILTNSFNPDVRVYKEAYYLVNKGFDVTILCWERDKLSKRPIYDSIDGIRVVRFTSFSIPGTGVKQLFPYFKFIIKCINYMIKNPTDYYHCNDLDGAIVWFFLKKYKSKMIFDMHEYNESNKYNNNIIRFLLRKINIFFIKKSEKSLYENDLYLRSEYNCVQEKLLPLKNYPSSSLLVSIPKVKSNIFRVAYHGAIRGQYEVFKSLFEAVKDLDDVRVDINGEGPDFNKVFNLAKNYKNVTLHGSFDGTKDLTYLYSISDVIFAGYPKGVLSSELEEVVKFYECIVTGTPIILTDCYEGMKKKINSRGYGLTCDTNNILEIKECILKLKEDKEFWGSCSRNELMDAHMYKWEKAVEILDKVYI